MFPEDRASAIGAASSREPEKGVSGVRVLVCVAQRAVVVLLGVKRHFRVRVLGSSFCARLTGMVLRGVLGLLWGSFSVLWRFVVHLGPLPGRGVNKPVRGLEAPDPTARQSDAGPSCPECQRRATCESAFRRLGADAKRLSRKTVGMFPVLFSRSLRGRRPYFTGRSSGAGHEHRCERRAPGLGNRPGL
jgi:hypothetical protein